MPTMVKIRPVRTFKGTAQQKAVFNKLKDDAPTKVDYGTAIEAINNSGGMYEIVRDAPAATVASFELNDMATDQLKAMYFQMGHQTPTGKQLRRADMIAAIQARLDAIEVLDDEVVADEGGEE